MHVRTLNYFERRGVFVVLHFKQDDEKSWRIPHALQDTIQRSQPSEGAGRLWRPSCVVSEVLRSPEVCYSCAVIISEQHVLLWRERSACAKKDDREETRRRNKKGIYQPPEVKARRAGSNQSGVTRRENMLHLNMDNSRSLSICCLAACCDAIDPRSSRGNTRTGLKEPQIFGLG